MALKFNAILVTRKDLIESFGDRTIDIMTIDYIKNSSYSISELEMAENVMFLDDDGTYIMIKSAELPVNHNELYLDKIYLISKNGGRDFIKKRDGSFHLMNNIQAEETCQSLINDLYTKAKQIKAYKLKDVETLLSPDEYKLIIKK